MNDNRAGLQPERTAIAWIRTGLVLAIDATLLARQGLVMRASVSGKLLLLLSAVLCCSYFALFWLRRRRRLPPSAAVPLPLAEIRLLVAVGLLASLVVLILLVGDGWLLYSGQLG